MRGVAIVYAVGAVGCILSIWLAAFLQIDSPPDVTTTAAHNEPYWTQHIARQRGWQAEVVTAIGTRCDLVNDREAVEVEWADKPYEAIGQALHYSEELGRQPAILFLVDSGSDRQYAISRAGKVADKYGIKIYWFDVGQAARRIGK